MASVASVATSLFLSLLRADLLTFPSLMESLQTILGAPHNHIKITDTSREPLPSLEGFCRCFWLSKWFEACTVSTEPTPAFLLISCISCNLLLPIKRYGEVLVEIRGSSHSGTGKFSCLYGEIHILRTGKFTPVPSFSAGKNSKAYGEVHHQCPSRLYEGSSPCSSFKPERTGKFTYQNAQLSSVRGSSPEFSS